MANKAEEILQYLPYKERVVLGGVIGSYNFNLADGKSDNDIRYYVFPTMADLVRRRMTRSLAIIKGSDVQVHDIRRTDYMFNMGDANQLSILFSKEQYINPKYKEFVMPLIEHREELVERCAPNMYAWGLSMYEKKMGQLDYFKRNEVTYEKYGYNTKAAGQAIYHLKLIERYFHNLEYEVDNPFEKAMDCSEIRDLIINIRNGKYSLEEFNEIADITLADYNSISNIKSNGFTSTPPWYLNAMYDACAKYST